MGRYLVLPKDLLFSFISQDFIQILFCQNKDLALGGGQSKVH